jgi:PKD repeat protein
MSGPDDELTPLSDDLDEKPKLSRSPYVALGAAALVISTVFATVAALASSRGDEAAPRPERQGTVETVTTETYTTEPTTVTSKPGKPTTKSSKSSTTTTTSEDETTTEVEETTTDENTTTPGRPTTPKPPTTTPKPPANKPPVASASDSCPDSGLTCPFSSGGSSDPDGSITSYQWNFGDGNTSNEANPSHTYGAAGTYSVTLTVTDNKGASDSTTTSVTVTAPPSTSGNQTRLQYLTR